MDEAFFMGGLASFLKILILGGASLVRKPLRWRRLGAQVIILDEPPRLRYQILFRRRHAIYQRDHHVSNEYNIRKLIKDADLIVGAVLIVGAKAPN